MSTKWEWICCPWPGTSCTRPRESAPFTRTYTSRCNMDFTRQLPYKYVHGLPLDVFFPRKPLVKHPPLRIVLHGTFIKEAPALPGEIGDRCLPGYRRHPGRAAHGFGQDRADCYPGGHAP